MGCMLMFRCVCARVRFSSACWLGAHVPGAKPDDFLDKTELSFRLDKSKMKTLLTDAGVLHHFDKDGDGTISIAELMESADANGDGMISLSEFL